MLPSVVLFHQQQRLQAWNQPNILERRTLLSWRGEHAKSTTAHVADAYARQAQLPPPTACGQS